MRNISYSKKTICLLGIERFEKAEWIGMVGLYSVVFYVGKGAGRHDTGKYQIKNPAGGLSLSWEYKVIRLWETKARKLLALGKQALLGLIGQTEITEPEELLPEVVAQVKTVSDASPK